VGPQLEGCRVLHKPSRVVVRWYSLGINAILRTSGDTRGSCGKMDRQRREQRRCVTHGLLDDFQDRGRRHSWVLRGVVETCMFRDHSQKVRCETTSYSRCGRSKSKRFHV
jgi:hypothetical protein